MNPHNRSTFGHPVGIRPSALWAGAFIGAAITTPLIYFIGDTSTKSLGLILIVGTFIATTVSIAPLFSALKGLAASMGSLSFGKVVAIGGGCLAFSSGVVVAVNGARAIGRSVANNPRALGRQVLFWITLIAAVAAIQKIISLLGRYSRRRMARWVFSPITDLLGDEPRLPLTRSMEVNLRIEREEVLRRLEKMTFDSGQEELKNMPSIITEELKRTASGVDPRSIRRLINLIHDFEEAIVSERLIMRRRR